MEERGLHLCALVVQHVAAEQLALTAGVRPGTNVALERDSAAQKGRRRVSCATNNNIMSNPDSMRHGGEGLVLVALCLYSPHFDCPSVGEWVQASKRNNVHIGWRVSDHGAGWCSSCDSWLGLHRGSSSGAGLNDAIQRSQPHCKLLSYLLDVLWITNLCWLVADHAACQKNGEPAIRSATA